MMKSRLPLFWIIAISTLVLDQVVKQWVRSTLSVGEFWKGGPWHGVFEFTLTYNKGIAFGMFQGSQYFMAPVAILIAGIATYNVYRQPRTSTRWMVVALALLASGSIGNLVDRVTSDKGVTDMFLLRLSNITNQKLGDFWVFNIADVCISIAMIMLAITWLRPEESTPTTSEGTNVGTASAVSNDDTTENTTEITTNNATDDATNNATAQTEATD
jgi:signal peptidase II